MERFITQLLLIVLLTPNDPVMGLVGLALIVFCFLDAVDRLK